MRDTITQKRILTYDDLVVVPPGSSSEELVDVRLYNDQIIAAYDKYDMDAFTGSIIFVRETVARKLATIQEELHASDELTLKIVYGYRSPQIQEAYFSTRKKQLHLEYPAIAEHDLNRLTHDFVAVPDVAGHPTGGAIDITLVNPNGAELDMGNTIADYTDPEIIKTFAKVTNEQAKNRKRLHDLMVKQNFAPFYGEWWHFSYGDREWAAFYNKKALYGAVDFRIK